MDQTRLQIRIINSCSIEPNGCWEWHKYTDRWGYGYLKVDGRNLLAHRAAFLAWNNHLPEVVRHSCDNPNCVNPEHLRAGTHADNVADRVSRQRSAIGSRNGRSKLTEEQVGEIKLALHVGGESKASLAKRFGVDPKVIRDIQQNKKWTHVTIGTARDLKYQA